MKKILLTLFILAASVYTGFAQNIDSFGIGGEIGVPVGSQSNLYDYSAGFSVRFEFTTHVKPLKFIASGGYTDFIHNNSVKNGTDADFVPIAIGAKYYLHHFYVQGEVGASFNVDSGYPGSHVALLYTPTIGYCVQALDFDEVDFGLGYQARAQTGGTLGQVLLHVSYKFNL